MSLEPTRGSRAHRPFSSELELINQRPRSVSAVKRLFPKTAE